jgi:hypothetical protein
MEDLVDEVVNFGSMANDDQNDACPYAINYLKGNPIDDKLISSGGHGIDDLEDYKNFEK